MEPYIVLAGLVTAIVLVVVIAMYNGFIRRRNRIRNAFASIDVQLKKRWDLIPQLVEAVRAYASHEKDVFERITRARHGIQAVESASRERYQYELELGDGVAEVMMLAEDYPELKAGDQFLLLQRNLTEVESQISASRRAFNAAITEWNEGVETFPGNLMARIFGFQAHEWFETPEDQRKAANAHF